METERTRRERIEYGRCCFCGEHKDNLYSPTCASIRCGRRWVDLDPYEQQRLIDAASHVTARR